MTTTYDQIKLNLPVGMRQALKDRAASSRRTMNSEAVTILERALRSETAATGEGLGNRAPAAAPDNSALAGAAIHQRS